MTRAVRPLPAVYLLAEAGLILGLTYVTFIGGAFAGLYSYGPRPVSQALIGLVAGVWLISKFLRRQPWPVTPLDRPLVVALGVVTLASLFSLHPRLSLDSAPVIFTYAFTFWFLYEQIQAAWFANLLLKCLFIVGAIVCLIASIELVRWYFDFPGGSGWSSLGLGIWPPTLPRIGGLSLGSPNHLSGYLILMAPLALASGLAAHKRGVRLTLWLLALFMLSIVGISRSRGGLLGALAGLAALGSGGWFRLGERWPRLRPSRGRIVGLALLLGGGLVAMAVVLAGRTRVGAAQVRLDMWASALKMAARRPLFGVGPGSFGLEYLRYRDTSQFSEVFSQAHNVYLHTLATLGVVGTLVSGWLVYKLVVTAWRLWRAEADAHWRWIRLGAMAGLAAFATHGLFDAFFFGFPAVFQLVIILAALALRPNASLPVTAPPPRWWLKPAVASALVVGWIGVALWSDAGFAAFDRGMRASQQGDWATTVEELKIAAGRDPAYDYYKQQLGLAYGQLAAEDPHYLRDAIAAYGSGGIEADLYALNHANLAWLLWKAGERDAAATEMTRAVQLEPINVNYHLNLGLMLEEMGQLEAAQREYVQAVGRAPELLKLSFWDEGQPAARRRERLVEMAMTLSPSVGSGQASLLTPGLAAYYLGEWHRARIWFETSLDAAPYDPDLWLNLAKVQLALAYPAQALDATHHAMFSGAPLGEVFALRAEAHLALGELEAATRDVQVVHFTSPDYKSAMLLGQLSERQGDFEGAAAAFQAAINSLASSAAVNYGPWVWKRPPLVIDTLSFFQRPVQSEALIQAYLALGNVYTRQGMKAEARKSYEAILSMNPDYDQARERLESLQ